MKTRNEIRAKIKQLRAERNYAQQFETTEGLVFLKNGAIKALEWILGYKRKPQFWCFHCALLHNNLKCPKCGNETDNRIDRKQEMPKQPLNKEIQQ